MQRTFSDTAHTPESDQEAFERGFYGDPKPLKWDDLLAFPRVLLVAEAGAGKTFECEARARAMSERGQAAFFLRLDALATGSVGKALRPKLRRRFKVWLTSSTRPGYFFLDSVDELQLVHATFRQALERLADELEGALSRAFIVVTSRPVPIDRQAFAETLPVPIKEAMVPDQDKFIRVAMRDPSPSQRSSAHTGVKEVTLLPLDKLQIAELARKYHVRSPDQLLEQIESRNAYDFARWPQELIELCEDWRQHGQIRPHHDQVESHVQARLTARVDRPEKADLSREKAREGAQRLALAALLCRQLTFEHGPAATQPGTGDEAVKTRDLLPEWKIPEITTLLERPLFGEGGYGRVRFRHRSELEYLAACQLEAQLKLGSLSVSAAKRILFGITDANVIVAKPSMRPVAAWLALLRADIFDAVLATDPATLLMYGDPESFSPTQCARALQFFVHRNGKGLWRGLTIEPIQISRLARQPLGATVLGLWKGNIENPEIRQFLMQLVAAGSYKECADLAASVARDSNGADAQRFDALAALVKLADPRATELIEACVSGALGWSETLRRWVGTNFYPEHMSEVQLLTLLRNVNAASGRQMDYADSVARVVEKANLEVTRLLDLLPSLATMTRSVVVATEEDIGEPGGRFKWSTILRAACVRLLKAEYYTQDVLGASVIAFRATDASDSSEKAELSKLLDAAPKQHRRSVLEFDYRWLDEQYGKSRGADYIFSRLVFDAPIGYVPDRDGAWVLGRLGKKHVPIDLRSMLLRLAIRLTHEQKVTEAAKKLRRVVADSPELIALLDAAIAARRPSPEVIQMLKAQKRRARDHERKRARERALWKEAWQELAKSPNRALSAPNRKRTIANISLALRNHEKNQGETRWNREFLQQSFGKKTTDKIRLVLMAEWRRLWPTFRSERAPGMENTYLVSWSNALMGLYAEAEDAEWATKLNPREAELVTRFALLELNQLPPWLVDVAAEHGKIVERLVGEEIKSELAEPGGPQGWHSMLLQKLRYAKRELTELLESRLLAWLHDERASVSPVSASHEAKLKQVAGVLLTHASVEVRTATARIALRGVKSRPRHLLPFWLSVLCRAEPAVGVDELLSVLKKQSVAANGQAVAIVGRLFDDRRDGASDWLIGLPPDRLGRLLRAVYRHVRPADDVEHDRVYSPGSRDHAEDGRRVIFDQLMAAAGPGAIEAKAAVARDAVFSSLADRIRQLAQERLAAELDSSIFGVSELEHLFAGSELPPKTGTDMAHLLINRLDDLKELMLHDASPRAAWAAVTDENALRSAIAREFDVMRRGAYTVDQEAVTADGKETDIRLRVPGSGLQATIELKLGEKKRSGTALRNTIEDQLIQKYMAHRDARTGCLLVTVSDPNMSWVHPTSRVRLDQAGLQKMLDEAAREAQQRLGGDARVLARVLDLTPRLATEAASRDGPRRRSASGASSC